MQQVNKAFGNMVKQTLALTDTPTVTNSPIVERAYTVESTPEGVYQVTTQTRYNAEGEPLSTIQKQLISQSCPHLESKTISVNERGLTSADWIEYTGTVRRIRKSAISTSDATAETVMADGFALRQIGYTGVTQRFSRTYRADGMVLVATDGRGNTTTTRTDILGRTVAVTDATGATTTTSYDPASGQPSVITDAMGNTSCYRYDQRGRKVAEWGTGIQPACFEYDEADRMTALTTFRASEGDITTDPSNRTDGDTTTWTYHDATGLETRKTYADGSHLDKSYDAYNRLSVETLARGITKTHRYEHNRGLLLGTTYNDGTTARNYTYNHLGQLTQVTDDAGTRIIGYNRFGEQDTDSLTTAEGVTHLITENRDSYGRSIGYVYSKDGETQQTVSTDYSTDGRIATAGFLHNGEEQRFTYSYLPGSSLLQQLSMPNGVTLTQAYEPQRNLLTEMSYRREDATLVSRSYRYDSLGRPIQRDILQEGNTRQDRFGYNTRSELTDAQLGLDAYCYDYDNIGNRKAAQGEKEATYTANALNQYTRIENADGTTHFAPAYDTDGNQTLVKTSTGVWNVEYNAENRPVTFARTEGSVTTRITCTYDSMGRRATKKVETNGETTLHQRYLYRGYLQIAACDLASDGAPNLWHILWDPTQAKSTRPLAIQKDGTWYAYAWDLTKNICEIFGQHGYIQTTYSYSPYGQVISDGDVTQPMQWSSEFCDEELGLTYYNFRYYNPSSGKWFSRDRVRNPNLYSFANNTPTSSIDILGLDVYWASRDLAGSPIGNHHFIIMTFSKPEDSTDPSNTLMLKCNECKIIYFVIYALFKTDSGKVEIRINDGFKKDGTNNIDSDVRSFVEFFCQTEGFWRDDDYQGNKIEPPKGKTREEFERDISESAKESKEYFEEHPTEYDLWDKNCATWVNDLMEHVGVSEQAREDGGEFFGVDVGEEDTAFSDSFKKN